MYNLTASPDSSIMKPLDVSLKHEILYNKPDIVGDSEYKSLTLTNDEIPNHITNRAFMLMEASENMVIPTPELFCKKLACRDDDKIKVVSIFGNTGDGKSHTMNHTFFEGEEVFKTSSGQDSCTLGVCAAMQHNMSVLCLDTEGQLGLTKETSRRMRMLLKILAISDIVIYRTRSERIFKEDMFSFLGNASKAFCSHFAKALQSLPIPGTAKTLGPAVIIFHETLHTSPLESSVAESAEDKLRHKFSELNYEINAFSSLRYVGIHTDLNKATDYSKLKAAIKAEIENTSVRSARKPSVIYESIKSLNAKFSGEILERPIFPEQYFTCPVECESCNVRCQRSMGHIIEGENHFNKNHCKYQSQFDNKVYLCEKCLANGRETVVTKSLQKQEDNSLLGIAKFAWKGSVIECPNCGEIYRERQYWYGNKSPEESLVIRRQNVHVWKGGDITAKGDIHSAQMLIDGVNSISETITNISAQPAKALTDWLADKVAPSYWRPNNEITQCYACKANFEKTGLSKHHCRGCGEGFCHACSQYEMPVPALGWTQNVRVCGDCRQKLLKDPKSAPENATEPLIHTNSNSNHNNIAGPPVVDQSDINVRMYGETIYNTVSTVMSVAVEFPKGIIKDTARPSYWVPDYKAKNCGICNMLFGTPEELEIAKARGHLTGTQSSSPAGKAFRNHTVADFKRHHCRRCGQVVCGECSKTRQPVPERGWRSDVRVCDTCAGSEREIGETKHKSE